MVYLHSVNVKKHQLPDNHNFIVSMPHIPAKTFKIFSFGTAVPFPWSSIKVSRNRSRLTVFKFVVCVCTPL